MKRIKYRKCINPRNRTKVFSIDSKTEDTECKTQVHKSFRYVLDPAREPKPAQKPPMVFIRKKLDTKRSIEEFSFHVKGYFYLTHNAHLMRVRFHHMLDIKIEWRAKNLSSKQPVSLT
jgi:hypothetical protein